MYMKTMNLLQNAIRVHICDPTVITPAELYCALYELSFAVKALNEGVQLCRSEFHSLSDGSNVSGGGSTVGSGECTEYEL